MPTYGRGVDQAKCVWTKLHEGLKMSMFFSSFLEYREVRTKELSFIATLDHIKVAKPAFQTRFDYYLQEKEEGRGPKMLQKKKSIPI